MTGVASSTNKANAALRGFLMRALLQTRGKVCEVTEVIGLSSGARVGPGTRGNGVAMALLYLPSLHVWVTGLQTPGCLGRCRRCMVEEGLEWSGLVEARRREGIDRAKRAGSVRSPKGLAVLVMPLR